MAKTGIKERLGRLFLLQLAAIGLATLVGIYITQLVVEDLLTRQALVTEADHFWMQYEANPDFALPNTANLQGYLVGTKQGADVPIALTGLEVGYHERQIDGRKVLVHVSAQDEQTLVLAFEGDQVSDLAFYFGILPLSIVLLLMYLLLFFAHRRSQMAMSPLVRLAEVVEAADLSRSGRTQLDLSEFRDESDAEIGAMVDALEHFTDRLDAAVERERNFTRDAGHELRTPVAVIKGSLDLLERTADTEGGQSKSLGKPLGRMRRAVQDMEALLESLLLLAREETTRMPKETCNVNEVVTHQLHNVSALAEQKGIDVKLVQNTQLEVRCPRKLLEIVTGNLIRNAVLYTDRGEVVVTVDGGHVHVSDTGKGMSGEQLARAFESFYRADESRTGAKGHGLGLSIVRRIVGSLGWELTLESELGEGTRAVLTVAP